MVDIAILKTYSWFNQENTWIETPKPQIKKKPIQKQKRNSGKEQRIKNILYCMISRCTNEKHISFKHYGARGINVCDEWKSNPKAFVEWSLSNGYADNLTIDRINNNKGYQPDNCKWATWSEQAINRSSTRLSYSQAFEIWCHVFCGRTAKSIASEYGCSKNLPREIYKGRIGKDAGQAAKLFMEGK